MFEMERERTSHNDNRNFYAIQLEIFGVKGWNNRNVVYTYVDGIKQVCRTQQVG